VRPSKRSYRELVEAGLSEMMGDDFRLGCGALGVIAQNFRRTCTGRNVVSSSMRR